MSKLIAVNREGEKTVIEGLVGRSVMQLMLDAGVDGSIGLCGGCCSCATCHSFFDPAFADRLPRISAQEDDMLNLSADRNETSRLACQIKWSDELDGLCVRLAPPA